MVTLTNKGFLSWIKYGCKRLLFPGLDLHTRYRYRFLPKFFRSGLIDTLDAGSGNGYLAYAAYKLGNRVLGIDSNSRLVEGAREYFNKIGTEQKRLSFETCNLYDLAKMKGRFDQIICSETLEHIQDDQLVIRYFYGLLRPEGVLHLCCPFAKHPINDLGRVNKPEVEGHVRDGYTLESYRLLLEPAGFKIMATAGLGSPLMVSVAEKVRLLRGKFGDLVAFPFFLLCWPLQIFDYLNPPLPYSLYVQAVKTAD
jgi:SAM-dependent methyltransferase